MNNETVSYKQETASLATAFVNRDTPRTRLIAGVSVPDGPLITAVIEHAQRLSEPYLFNHAMRSWLFAEAIGRIKGIEYDREVVAIGTILHDIGLTAGVSGPNRFEVNGADAALVVHHTAQGRSARTPPMQLDCLHVEIFGRKLAGNIARYTRF